MLTEDTARNIGISAYYPLVRKSFNDILKALDSQFGRPLMMTTTQNVNKVRYIDFILSHNFFLYFFANCDVLHVKVVGNKDMGHC